MNPQTISTGIPPLDQALGIGGFPCGAITEIFGEIGSGKTSLCLTAVARAQSSGLSCAWLDCDNSLDAGFARICGVNPDRLYLIYPNSAEQAWGMIEDLSRSNGFDLIVVDAIQALVPFAELSGFPPTEEASAGNHLAAQCLPGIEAALHLTHTALILTHLPFRQGHPVYHHLKSNMDRLALQLHASLRIQLQKGCDINLAGKPIGNNINIKVKKNHFYPCSRAITLDIIYTEGIQFSDL
jgi:recombination protein RecA